MLSVSLGWARTDQGEEKQRHEESSSVRTASTRVAAVIVRRHPTGGGRSAGEVGSAGRPPGPAGGFGAGASRLYRPGRYERVASSLERACLTAADTTSRTAR